MTRSHAFSRALRQLHAITFSFDWFSVLSVSFVIAGRLLWFWFYDIQLKTAQIMSRTLKVTGNHVLYDRGALFLRVIMSSLRTLCCLPSVKKQKRDFNFFFRSMYNKTIIRFGFCDIQNNRGLGKG